MFKFRKIFIVFIWGVIFVVGSIIIIGHHVESVSRPYIPDSSQNIPAAQAALVLGSKVYSNGMMSDMFMDRVLTAIDLYKQGKVQKILISGDHGTSTYDEVNVAREFIIEKRVPSQDIFLDHAGFDTYDSVYRAKNVFQVNSMVVVSQSFHLPRALYIAKKLQMEAYGLSADRRVYVSTGYSSFREIFARVKAFLNITFGSQPKYLGQPIPITGDGRVTWDK